MTRTPADLADLATLDLAALPAGRLTLRWSQRLRGVVASADERGERSDVCTSLQVLSSSGEEVVATLPWGWGDLPESEVLLRIGAARGVVLPLPEPETIWAGEVAQGGALVGASVVRTHLPSGGVVVELSLGHERIALAAVMIVSSGKRPGWSWLRRARGGRHMSEPTVPPGCLSALVGASA